MTIRHVIMTLLLSALALLNVASSCSTVNNYPPNNYPPDRYPQGGGYPGGGYNSRVIITEGTGRLTWNADQNGDVYVYNARENRLVFNGPIRRGDQIVVEPGNDRILMNDRVVYQHNLEKDDRHQIAFERTYNNYPPGPGRGRGNGAGNYSWYRDGVVITEGDDRLGWNCDQSGQVYVYDYGEDKLVWNGPIQRGQRIEVIPGQDRITIDGRNVYNQNLRKNARHQIVLVRLPGDRGGRGGRGGEVAPVIPDPIPNGARRMAEGTGNISIGEVPGDGRVFVYDETDKHMLYDTQIEKNNSFQIFPNDDYVNLNSKKRADVRFVRGHRHSLYFRAR